MPSRSAANALELSFAAALESRRMLADPVSFLQKAGLDPDPWQVEVLRCTDPQIQLNCSRQSGKTLITAGLAMYRALTIPRQKVLMVSKAERQAKGLLKQAEQIYYDAGRPITAVKSNTDMIALANRSEIYALPGSSETIRGLAGVTLLIIEEAAFVPDELYKSVRPMLATTQGQIITLSSPFGKRGWWWDAWHACELAKLKGEPEPWRRFEVPATSCPRITPAWLASERREMGEWWFLQEYFCKFLDALTMPFSSVDVEAAMRGDVKVWDLPPLPLVGEQQREGAQWALPELEVAAWR